MLRFAKMDYFFCLWRFRSRTPAPPPFSSMNSMPALSSATRIFSTVVFRPPRGPSTASSRLIVGREILAAAAYERTAFSWRIDTFSIDIKGDP
ncbi:MAG: hypothetical protein WA725_13995, partial [Pseudolabrys sp.]